MPHGGPGFPEMRLLRFSNAPLEKDFTLIYWGQRGTEKSFDRKIPAPSMNVEQFISDLDELVEAMRERFEKDKVAIYGHSWGSALGVLYASRSPHKVAAFVCAGQVGDWPASELRCYESLLAEAERRGNRNALRELRAIGPPPHTGQRQMVQGKWQTRFLGMVRVCLCGGFHGSFSVDQNSRCSIFPTFCVGRYLRSVLEAHRITSKNNLPDDLVFGTPARTPLNQKNLYNRVLAPACDRIKQPRVSWHSFRHTHAALLTEVGESIKTAQALLGHSDLGTTLNTYSHVIPDSQRRAVERVAGVLFSDVLKLEETAARGEIN